jgi:hypothetical protein
MNDSYANARARRWRALPANRRSVYEAEAARDRSRYDEGLTFV